MLIPLKRQLLVVLLARERHLLRELLLLELALEPELLELDVVRIPNLLERGRVLHALRARLEDELLGLDGHLRLRPLLRDLDLRRALLDLRLRALALRLRLRLEVLRHGLRLRVLRVRPRRRRPPRGRDAEELGRVEPPARLRGLDERLRVPRVVHERGRAQVLEELLLLVHDADDEVELLC